MKVHNDTHDGDLYGILNKSNIKQVQFGLNKRFDTWYGNAVYFNKNKTLGYKSSSSSFGVPKENSNAFWLDTLFVCEYCFKYTDEASQLVEHVNKCSYKQKAPGRIKYKSPEHTIRRIKGIKHEIFCQCLCLFTKLFLDNKSMYFKMSSYEFYILYETGSTLPMAFFSKDLFSYNKNNLACILTFPPYQRRKLGTLLIDFSYRLSKNEGIISGPETPLSPFGLVGYLMYWSFSITWHLIKGELINNPTITLTDISIVTGIRIQDIIDTLEYMGCITDNYELLLPVVRDWARDHHVERGFMIRDSYLLLND